MSQLPGLSTLEGSKISRSSSIVNSVSFNVNVGGATNFALPFNVSDPHRITIRYAQELNDNVLAHVLEFIPTSLLSAALKIVPDRADHTKDITVSYNIAGNYVTVTPGTLAAVGLLQVILYDRVAAKAAILTDPGSTNPSPLPFYITDFGKTWLGNNLQYHPNPGLFVGGGIAAAYPNAWHLQGYVSAVASKEMLKIINNNTFQWGGAAFTSNGFYLLEFV